MQVEVQQVALPARQLPQSERAAASPASRSCSAPHARPAAAACSGRRQLARRPPGDELEQDGAASI